VDNFFLALHLLSRRSFAAMVDNLPSPGGSMQVFVKTYPPLIHHLSTKLSTLLFGYFIRDLISFMSFIKFSSSLLFLKM